MQARITPTALGGTVSAIASKSMAHRLIICAALSDGPTAISCGTSCADIDATVSCLTALGARIERDADRLLVTPVPRERTADGPRTLAQRALLDCNESGSTFRFMLPVAAALDANASLTGAPRLAERPISPLYEELIVGGCSLSEKGSFPLSCEGRLRPGRFELPGDVSSQYISGLMLAALAMDGVCEIAVTGRIESRPYVDMTVRALGTFGVRVEERPLPSAEGDAPRTLFVLDGRTAATPGETSVEGDWSNAAFWLCAGALSDRSVTVEGIDPSSPQGDRNIMGALLRFGARVERRPSACTVHPHKLGGFEMSAADVPDLVPVIAAVAATARGTTVIRDCARLRIKESDRLSVTAEVLNALGARVLVEGDALVIEGVDSLAGGTISTHNDHRIAMMAAVAAARATAPVVIEGAEAVDKSYPRFFDDYRALGGRVELAG